MKKIFLLLLFSNFLLLNLMASPSLNEILRFGENGLSQNEIEKIYEINQKLEKAQGLRNPNITWDFEDDTIVHQLPESTDSLFNEGRCWTKDFSSNINVANGIDINNCELFYNTPTERFEISAVTDINNVTLKFEVKDDCQYWYGSETLIIGVKDNVTDAFATAIIKVNVSPVDNGLVTNYPQLPKTSTDILPHIYSAFETASQDSVLYLSIEKNTTSTIDFTHYVNTAHPEGIQLLKTVDEINDPNNYEMYITSMDGTDDITYSQTPAYVGKQISFIPDTGFSGTRNFTITAVDNGGNFTAPSPETNVYTVKLVVNVLTDGNQFPVIVDATPTNRHLSIEQGDNVVFNVDATDETDLNFLWTVEDNDPDERYKQPKFSRDIQLASNLDYTFTMPGNYTVKCEVSDYELDAPEETWEVVVTPKRPMITPDGGVYLHSVVSSIIVPDDFPNANLYYTLDGSEPSQSSTPYTGEIDIAFNPDVDTTLKAKYFDPHYGASVTNEVIYAFTTELETPTFSPVAGTYESNQYISINATQEASIYYTINGSDPVIGNQDTYLFNSANPILVSEYKVIKAIAHKTGWDDSNIAIAEYFLKCSEPIFNKESNTYDSAIEISLASVVADSEIYFTLDGSTPNRTSLHYTQPFTINNSTVVKAIVLKNNWLNSDIATRNYTFKCIAPVLSPGPGIYAETPNIQINSNSVDNYDIWYTLDGSNPEQNGANSLHYTNNNIVLPSGEATQVRARAFYSSWEPSNIVEGYYYITGKVTISNNVLEPLSGLYYTEQTINFNNNNTVSPSDAVLRYTIDGSEPTSSSPILDTNTDIVINNTSNSDIEEVTVRIKGFKNQWNDSDVFNAVYRISGKVESPQFSLVPGIYSTEQNLELISAIPNTELYYSFGQDSNPLLGTLYDGNAINLAERTSTFIKVIAKKNEWANSDILSGTFVITGKLSTPTFTPNQGLYVEQQNVSIFVAEANADIRYTTDGSEPDITSDLYINPVVIPENSNITLKAKAFKNNWIDSDTAIANYQITSKVSQVVFNPQAGHYQTEQNVELTTTTNGAEIRYTIDGSVPNEVSALYTNPINVSLNSSMTIQAIAYKTDWAPSDITSATYNVTGQVAFNQPVFSPASGTYQTEQNVLISGTSPIDADIYYTIDGTEPNQLSAIYNNSIQIPLNSNITLKVKAYKVGWTPSQTLEANYNITGKVLEPTFSLAEGEYNQEQQVTISSENGTQIYYTIDGSIPDTNSNLYVGQIDIDQNMTIKAVATKADWISSNVVTKDYSLKVENPNYNLDSALYTTPQNIEILTNTNGAEIRYTLDGSIPNSSSILYTTPININSTTMFKAIALKNGWNNSAVVERAYLFGQEAVPILSQGTGTYSESFALTITSVPANAEIRYNLSNSDVAPNDPTETTGTLYTGPIDINQNSKIKVIAYGNDLVTSDIIFAKYSLKARKPVIFPASGTYQEGQTVSISSETPNSSIKYSIDGSDPLNGLTYSTPFSLDNSAVVRAIVVKDHWLNSDITESNINIIIPEVLDPLFSQDSGNYDDSVQITLSCPTVDADIYYTIDGTIPDNTSNEYSSVLNINQTTTVKAIAYKNGVYSNVVSAYYVINDTSIVETPTFTPAPDLYTTSIDVNIACNTPNVDIYYTLDGSIPDANAVLYNSAIHLAESTTLKAVAIKNGNTSDIAVAGYIINLPQLAIPTFTPDGGTYYSEQAIEINAENNAVIKYSLDGSDPDINSLTYNNPIIIPMDSNIIVKAIAMKDNFKTSNIASAIYNVVSAPVVATPTFDVNPGTFANSVDVELACETQNSVIYYTLDGSIPTNNSNLYDGALHLTQTSDLSVIAYLNNQWKSRVLFGHFVITSQVETPTVTQNSGIYTGSVDVELNCATNNAEIYYTLDGSNPDNSDILFDGNAIHINQPTILKAKAIKSDLIDSEILTVDYGIKLNNPNVSHNSGYYENPIAVSLNVDEAPNDASIYYTTDGSSPRNISSRTVELYDGTPINISTSTTLKVFARRTGYTSSNIVERSYIYGTSSVPILSAQTGLYQNEFDLTINSIPEGANIRYTLDGSIPSESNGNIYTGAIQINENTTIKVVSYGNQLISSSVVTANYTFKPYNVTYTEDSNSTSPWVEDNHNIVLSSNTNDAVIYYTTDGSEPNSNSIMYLNPVNISENTLIKAIATKNNWNNSDVESRDYYFKNSNPVITPASGEYGSAQNVSITCSTPNVNIYYTLDGSEPTSNSNLYNSEFSVDSSTIIKAIALRNNRVASDIITSNIEILPILNNPQFSVVSGEYFNDVNVYITSNINDTEIRYTLDGSIPDLSSSVYSSQLTISEPTTIKAKAYKTGWISSDIATIDYDFKCSRPVFNILQGTYQNQQNILLSSATLGAVIRYTTDGSVPTNNSAIFSTPITIPENTSMTIKAKAFRTNWENSDMVSATYTITDQVTPVTFSVPSGIYQTAQNVTLESTTYGAVIRYTTDGTIPNETSSVYYSPIEIPLQSSMQIKAIAYKENWQESQITSADYVVTDQVQSVEFSLPSGIYTSQQYINLSTPTLGAVIRYTTDGSDPNENSTRYIQAIVIPENTVDMTIKAIAYKENWTPSDIANATYTTTDQVANVQFSVAPGIYQTAQSISLSTITADAEIRYTTDGSDPDQNSDLFSQAINIPLQSTMNIKARAYKQDWAPSNIATAQYTVTDQVANVQFSLAAGTYPTQQNLTLQCATADANIRYTIDGSEPTEQSATYLNMITLPLFSNITVKARAFKENWTTSEITQREYTITGSIALAQPVFAPVEGIYTESQNVVISNPNPADAQIRYTTDGSEPDESSQLYSGNILVDHSLVLKVKAFKTDWNSSATYTANYTITGQITMNVDFQPQAGIYTDEQSVNIDFDTTPSDAVLRYTTDGSDPSNSSDVVNGNITIPTNTSLTIKVKAFKENWIASDIASASYQITGACTFNNNAFDLDEGIYTSAKVVNISTDIYPVGATIYYTTDGSDPDENSTQYNGAIQLPLDSQTTIKTIIKKDNWVDSQISSATYTITGQVAITGEVFSVIPGIYTEEQNVEFTGVVNPNSATVRFTTDGSEPTIDSPLFSAAVNIPTNSDMEIKVKAFANDWIDSQVTSANYSITGQITLPENLFSLADGIYTEQQELVITQITVPESSVIRYTLDGSDPTQGSPEYDKPIMLQENNDYVVKVKAFASNWLASETATANYQITGTVENPVIDKDSGYYPEEILVSISCNTDGASIRYTTDGTEPNIDSALYTEPVKINYDSRNLKLKAKAYKQDWVTSNVTEKTYSIYLIPVKVSSSPYNGYVRVLWNSPIASRAKGLDGFNVYRTSEVQQDTIKVNKELVPNNNKSDYHFDDYSIKVGELYTYYVKAVYDGIESAPSAPTTITYQANDLVVNAATHVYPNPAKKSTTIKLMLSRNENVKVAVTIFDFSGKKINTLRVPTTDSNLIEIPWNLKTSKNVKVGRGVYFARIVATDDVNKSEQIVKIAVK